MARITLIDDQLSVRVAVRAVLESAGHTVSDFEDGREALRRLDEGCDLVITDMMMPGMDGLEVLAHVKKHRPGLPILAITGGWGNREVDLLSVADRLGADASLPKATLLQKLLPTVAKMLRRPPAPATG